LKSIFRKSAVTIIVAWILFFPFTTFACAEEQSTFQKELLSAINEEGKLSEDGGLVGVLNSMQGLVIENGSRGDYVKEVQSLLITESFLAEGEADGICGNKTATAVNEFQSNSELNATGVADLYTQFVLIVSTQEATEYSDEDDALIVKSGNSAVVVWPDNNFFIGLLDAQDNIDYGTYYFNTGEYYAGDFDSDKRSGEGTAYFPNGDIYVGQWSDDQMSGTGTYYFGGTDSGEYYTGEWAENKMNGSGQYTLSSGQIITGTWENNSHTGW